MMRTVLTFALLAVATVASAQEPVDYSTAYHRTVEGDKPLLVLVTAAWCPPCQIMKATTIPELVAQNSFAGVNYATVDYDAQPELATQLIGELGLPQMLIYRKVGDQWEKRFLAGIQTVASVEQFMTDAGVVRVAAAIDPSVTSSGTVPAASERVASAPEQVTDNSAPKE
jgi:thiol:disulfide interchange protein